ncbi:MAG: hypothetical protein GF398_13855 [Chitinivibrionales bacterium]|nr:hypothetical protein [Chitinivibrionales bacterium]
MECTKWGTDGLLYTSDELTHKQKAAYERHLDKCAYCRKHLADYRVSSQSLFTVEVLGASPSAQTDAEILRVCSSSAKTTSLGLFSGLFRRVAVSALLVVIGFAGAGYFVYLIEDTRQEAVRLAKERNAIPQQPTSPVVEANDKMQLAGDLPHDSSKAEDSTAIQRVRPYNGKGEKSILVSEEQE